MTYEEYPINKKGTDYVVGDIHGEYQKLISQLYRIGFDKEKDRLFSVGDLIDRGPDNLKCLGLIEEPWFHAVCGNHEDMMLTSSPYWYPNGGDWHHSEVENASSEIKKHYNRLFKKAKALPYAITVYTEYGSVGICHAQPPTNDWEDVAMGNCSHYHIQEMMWGRSDVKNVRPPVDNVTYTVHGHTPCKKPIINQNRIFIDSGAVFYEHKDLIILNISQDPKEALLKTGEVFLHEEYVEPEPREFDDDF